MGIINFHNSDLGFAAVFFGFNAAFAANVFRITAYRCQFIHAIMNIEDCPGRKPEVENRKHYSKNLFHWNKVKNYLWYLCYKIMYCCYKILKNKKLLNISGAYSHLLKLTEQSASYVYLILNSSFTLKKRPVRRTGTGYIRLVLASVIHWLATVFLILKALKTCTPSVSSSKFPQKP